MIKVRLDGGLGNQMFQYAIADTIAQGHNTKVKIDTTNLYCYPTNASWPFRDYALDIFLLDPQSFVLSKFPMRLGNIGYRIKNNRFTGAWRTRFPNRKLITERQYYDFDPKVLAAPDNSCLEGYWQNAAYFENSKNRIRSLYAQFRYALTPDASAMLEAIVSSNSVCVSFRRTDYVSVPAHKDFHGVLDLDYYARGIEIIRQRTEHPHLFIFSDDIEWCRQNFKSDLETTFVGDECSGPKFSNKFQLMTACKHFIIPNSSFAWWGAWLSVSPRKIVVAPQRWVTDPKYNTAGLILNDWVTA